MTASKGPEFVSDPTRPAVKAEVTEKGTVNTARGEGFDERDEPVFEGSEIMTVSMPKAASSTIFWTIGLARIGRRS